MKIVIIHGQNHKGSTYHIGRMLGEKLGGKIKKIFLPKDFGEFSVGCTMCFMKGECRSHESLVESLWIPMAGAPSGGNNV